MKKDILKVLIVVGMLILPLVVPGASNASLYNFELDKNGFGLILRNDVWDAYNDHRVGTFQTGVNNFSVDGGNGKTIHGGLLTFNTGAWTKCQGWESGSLTLSFGKDRYGNPLLFSADHLKITYELDRDHNKVFRIFMTDYSQAFFSKALANFFHIPEKGWKGSFELTLYASGLFKSFQLTGSNEGTSSSVPIPPTALLFGAGLIGIGIVRKRIK